MKKGVSIVLLATITILLMVVGNMYFSNKIESEVTTSRAEVAKYNKQKEADEAANEKKIAEEKQRIYNEHKGETLRYSPMGDSLALGLYATKQEAKYVSVFTDLIEENLGYNVIVGNGAVDGGKGLRDLGVPNLPNVISENPDLVTIEFGTNDSDKTFESTYSTPKEFKDRLTYVVKTLKNSESSPKIVLVTTWNLGERSLQYDEIINQVSKEQSVPVANIQSVWMNRSDTANKGYTGIGGESDGWHPNDLGHKEIAEKVFEEAYELLK